MAKKLPSQYIELEYIESNGSQYIDTEYIANSETEIRMVFMLNNKQRYGLYGGQIQEVDTALRAFANGNLLFFAHGGSRMEQTNNLLINTKYSLVHNKTKITINNTNYITSQFTNYQNTTLTIAKCNGFGSDIYAMIGKIYSFEIYDNNTLIKKFVPCKQKAYNTIGMYDLVNDKFHINKGTGSFVAGPEIPQEEEVVDTPASIDWTKSMTQTFEYYEVDPISWKDKKRLTEVTGSSITRDLGVDTLGSATIDVVNMVGETYIRIYLVTNQNGITEKHPLGTYLVQTPKSSFDGKNNNVSMDAYTPLIELKENNVLLGYTILKGENILDNAYQITKDNCRCPVVKPTSDKILNSDFVANTDDKYMTFIRDLLNQGKFQFDLDEMGRILFRPVQKTETLQPVCTFNDDNSSILYPEMTLKHDLYGIPNIVEVYARYNGKLFHSIAKNDDPASPTSIVNRGRKIVYRITDPGLPGIPTQEQIDDYAKDVLSEASSLEYTITFTHGYYPCRPGDCVRLNYKRAGLQDIKAKIISQNITCDSGVKVKTTAVFTKKLWS